MKGARDYNNKDGERLLFCDKIKKLNNGNTDNDYINYVAFPLSTFRSFLYHRKDDEGNGEEESF